MTKYMLILKATNRNGERWLSNNEFDYQYAFGLEDLKYMLSEIEHADGVEVEVLYKFLPHGCFANMTKRYVKNKCK